MPKTSKIYVKRLNLYVSEPQYEYISKSAEQSGMKIKDWIVSQIWEPTKAKIETEEQMRKREAAESDRLHAQILEEEENLSEQEKLYGYDWEKDELYSNIMKSPKELKEEYVYFIKRKSKKVRNIPEKLLEICKLIDKGEWKDTRAPTEQEELYGWDWTKHEKYAPWMRDPRDLSAQFNGWKNVPAPIKKLDKLATDRMWKDTRSEEEKKEIMK